MSLWSLIPWKSTAENQGENITEGCRLGDDLIDGEDKGNWRVFWILEVLNWVSFHFMVDYNHV